MDFKQEIIKRIQAMSGSQSVYNIFTDWIKMYALAISNSVEMNEKVFKRRENEYLGISGKYSKEELLKFSELCAFLTEAFQSQYEDVLGYIYMHLEVSSKNLGQFFTPYHICRLMAQVSGAHKLEDGQYIEVSEPSCGAGANIIAFVELLRERKINYQECVKVVCQDLDWNSVYMCYVQLSMYGVPAVVVQGDSLQNSYNGKYDEHVLITPMLKQNDWILTAKKKVQHGIRHPAKNSEVRLKTDEQGQMTLVV